MIPTAFMAAALPMPGVSAAFVAKTRLVILWFTAAPLSVLDC